MILPRIDSCVQRSRVLYMQRRSLSAAFPRIDLYSDTASQSTVNIRTNIEGIILFYFYEFCELLSLAPYPEMTRDE